MKFGLLNELQPGPFTEGPDEARQREQEVYFEAAEQTVLSEELGFDYCWVVEHHGLTEYSASPAPECWLSWVAGQTSRVRLGFGVVQLSKQINHVVRVAERVAALDVISNGRVEFGSGRGFTHDEVITFEVNPDETRGMQLEGMSMLPEIWAEEEYEFDNEFYKIPRRRLTPKPVQRPHPPMWLACSQPASWQAAGERGLGVLGFGFPQPRLLEESMKTYREALKTSSPKYGAINDRVGLSPPFYCAATDEEAFEVAAPHVLFYLNSVYGFVNQWKEVKSEGYKWYREMSDDFLALPDLSAKERQGLSEEAQVVKAGVKGRLFCVGSPETCHEVVSYYDNIGVEQVLFQAQLGRLPHDQIQDSMKRFAAEVLPEFVSDSAG